MRRPLVRFLADRCGSSAAEFALVLPLFLLLVLGTIHISFAVYAASTLHWAVEAAARCASVRAGSTCPTFADIQTYAASMYQGPGIGANFVASVDLTCGSRVTGTGSYGVHAGLLNVTIPLSATACYP